MPESPMTDAGGREPALRRISLAWKNGGTGPEKFRARVNRVRIWARERSVRHSTR